MNNGNIHIEHSCDATDADIVDKVYRSMEFFYDNIDLFFNRTPESIIREWVVHNAMYKVGLFRSRTESVDLNRPLPWWESIIYWIAYPIARLIVE